MDDMEFLVNETFSGVHAGSFRHPLLPETPGVLYHLQEGASMFVARTLPVDDLALAHARVLANPEEYPTLRLLEDGGDPAERLRWFSTSTMGVAEHLHERVGQRRFPKREEELCNLSDPGFSWWLERRAGAFSLHAKMNQLKGAIVRLGPLHDVHVATARWLELGRLLAYLPLAVEVGTGTARFNMSSVEAPWLVDEFARAFLEGEVGEGLRDVFRVLAKRGAPAAALESAWFFLEEAAAVRRFWLQLPGGQLLN
jgi:hypothetical protein